MEVARKSAQVCGPGRLMQSILSIGYGCPTVSSTGDPYSIAYGCLMSRSRYVYRPNESGWIVIRDHLRNVIEAIDCSAGRAQEVFEKRCTELQADGWELERRFGDWRFISRPPERWHIGIERNPYEPMREGAGKFCAGYSGG